MTQTTTVPRKLAQALQDHADLTALVDCDLTLSYGQLADCIDRLAIHLQSNGTVAIFGKPSVNFGAVATACVVLGRPFVHLDPAMPTDVLTNIVAELAIDVVFLCQAPKVGQLPATCQSIDALTILKTPANRPPQSIVAADVAPDDIIYVVATSGTTGKPKCIPVTHQSAHLSYEWRDEFTPYEPQHTVGIYIFAIWEMFRPLRDGAKLCFPRFNELLNPDDLAAFLTRHTVTEMLFTPSALEKILQTTTAEVTQNVPLQRVILNGEVVSDDLVAAVREKLPNVTLWNLYSICETHDISMTKVSGPQGRAGAASVGVAMPHIKAVVLDDNDQICAAGQPGLLHFEGPRMLGPGYVNRPEETALRFRELTLNGQFTRLYDTGDQGYIAADGSIHVMGRVAHMLKLRGHSIQTRDLTESLHSFVAFSQGVPWIQEIDGQGKALVLYYCANPAQSDENRAKWGLEAGDNRLPAALSQALRAELPFYCIPSFLVQLDTMPVNAVSGKCDYKALPKINAIVAEDTATTNVLPTVAKAAEIMCCPAATLDPSLSFHDQGGDSLMAVNLLLALEAAYGCRVDFDFALNVPLGRLHDILSSSATRPQAHGSFERSGILLTGATGFLGSRVMAAAARSLPDGDVIYCLIRPKRRDAIDRLHAIAAEQGVDPARLVLIPAALEDVHFGLDDADYATLTSRVRSVIHCAAMVNLAVDRDHMEVWSQAGIANILQFCRDASADLRFSSTSAVFADTGGPYDEAATAIYPQCSGYGAAKIEAEHQIAKSGVAASIVRLPSLYDLDAPNSKDIYEVIMAACAQIQAVPEGFAFRMIDVHAAARFLADLIPTDGARYFNLTPNQYATTALLPEVAEIAVIPVENWLRAAPLSDAERALIASDLTALKATATLTHDAAQKMWEGITEQSFASLSSPAELLARRVIPRVKSVN
ncbi:AMP-binding protein [Falsihalocynthiibacter sp. S25ZX9]|uniref:AMP-binding protein n=1 Tax=Falsihalocynthiibacter sp. S25ZX9 TaxID=3240870 RepID=UPI00350F241E